MLWRELWTNTENNLEDLYYYFKNNYDVVIIVSLSVLFFYFLIVRIYKNWIDIIYYLPIIIYCLNIEKKIVDICRYNGVSILHFWHQMAITAADALLLLLKIDFCYFNNITFV